MALFAIAQSIVTCYSRQGSKGRSGQWIIPDSKVHGANMGPIWGHQDPGGPHVGPINFAICNTLNSPKQPTAQTLPVVLWSLSLLHHKAIHNSTLNFLWNHQNRYCIGWDMGVIIKLKHWFMLCLCHCSAENNVMFILDQIITAPVLCGWMTMLQWTLMICFLSWLAMGPWGHMDQFNSKLHSCNTWCWQSTYHCIAMGYYHGYFYPRKKANLQIDTMDFIYCHLQSYYHLSASYLQLFWCIISRKRFERVTNTVLNAVNGYGVTCHSHQNVCNMFGVFLKLFQSFISA